MLGCPHLTQSRQLIGSIGEAMDNIERSPRAWYTTARLFWDLDDMPVPAQRS